MAHEGSDNEEDKGDYKEDKGGDNRGDNNEHKQAETNKQTEGKAGMHIPRHWPYM
jgi:hypothetical protein